MAVKPYFAPERHERIQTLLSKQQRVSVAQLVSTLGVSPVTIRSDLTTLERQGLLTRIHGGAIRPTQTTDELDFEHRAHQQSAAKNRIGAMAATLVPDGDSIILDASTTALHLAREIRTRRELTVITTGLRTAETFMTNPAINVIMPGGFLRRETFSIVGDYGGDLLKEFHVHRAFLGAKGFTLEEGLTDVSPQEVELKRALVAAAAEVIGLIDHTKWGQVALASFCALDRVTAIITDRRAPLPLVEAARAQGVQVYLV